MYAHYGAPACYMQMYERALETIKDLSEKNEWLQTSYAEEKVW